jgi:hypothetical protein
MDCETLLLTIYRPYYRSKVLIFIIKLIFKNISMQKTVTQIGNFSYFPDKIIGQGSTGSVYKGI